MTFLVLYSVLDIRFIIWLNEIFVLLYLYISAKYVKYNLT